MQRQHKELYNNYELHRKLQAKEGIVKDQESLIEIKDLLIARLQADLGEEAEFADEKDSRRNRERQWYESWIEETEKGLKDMRLSNADTVR